MRTPIDLLKDLLKNAKNWALLMNTKKISKEASNRKAEKKNRQKEKKH